MKEGSVDKIAVALMTLIIGGVLIFTNIAFIQAMEIKSEINVLARKNILYMESNGPLDAVQKANLLSDIRELGAVVADGTDGIKYTVPSEVDDTEVFIYGSEVFIDISGSIPLTIYDYANGKKTVLIDFRVRRSSIAKYN